MPIYLFNCTSCPHQFEKITKREAKTAICPFCGHEAERGIETPSPFVWGKSGGWS